MFKKKNELNKAKKNLLRWFKTAYLIKRNNGMIVPDKIKESIKQLIENTNNIEFLDIIEFNKVNIINSIPDTKKEGCNIQLFLHTLELIKNKFNRYENKFMFIDEDESNMSLFTLLGDINDITFRGRMSVLIDNINNSDNEIKTKCYLILFELVNKINDYSLFDTINISIKNEYNIDKLNQIYNLLLKCRYIKFDNKDMNIRDIVNTFIKFIKDNSTNKYINVLINNLFKDDIINYIDIKECDNIINVLLVCINNLNYILGEYNIKLLLNLSKDKNFIFMKDKDLQNKLISFIIDIDIMNEEYLKMLEDIIKTKILTNENKNIKEYIISELYEINNIESMLGFRNKDNVKSLVLKK